LLNLPDLSVVVVSWRTRELTLACLDSIRVEADRGELRVETILVDNASGDGTVEAVRREHAEAIVVENDRNLGFAAGCNAGLARCTGQYVLFLNPDAEATPGTLPALVRFLDTHPEAGAVGARLVSASGEAQFSAGRFLTPLNQFAEVAGLSRFAASPALRRSYDEETFDGRPTEVDWVVGACLAVRRAALDQVGSFDERFFMYGEDEDLCYRLRKADWRVYLLAGAAVRHEGGQSAAQALARMRVEVRASQTEFLRKHRGRASVLVFRALMWLASLKPRRAPDRVGWGR
jgi:N-acetylglucosaminyl-diphospho-decaprenol L-rhamnosyltransferase